MLSVKQRQINLNFLGFYNGEIDGLVGKGTIKAYKNFQKKYGLKADGVYGVKTDSKLISVIKDIQKELGVDADGIVGAKTIEAQEWTKIKYFKKSEFTCKCGCKINNINLKLVKILDQIRKHFGKPVYITSGTRCTKHNKEVGGVPNSRHLQGKAADLYVSGVDGSKLLDYTKKLVSQKKLRYTYLIAGDAVHVDIE